MKERRKKARLGDSVSLDERRGYVRLARGQTLRVREFQFGDQPPSYFDARYRDVSGGGVLFESERPYTVGTILKMQITVPGWDRHLAQFYKLGSSSVSQPLVVLAEVVRVDVLSREKSYQIGVVFIGIDEDHRAALLKHIADEFSR